MEEIGSDWGLVASSDFKSDGPGLIPGTVGSIPTHFRQISGLNAMGCTVFPRETRSCVNLDLLQPAIWSLVDLRGIVKAVPRRRLYPL